jgi:hypothetical protein
MNETPTHCPVCEANRFEALYGLSLMRECIPLVVGLELEKRAMKAKAEVERLKSKLRRAVEITEGLLVCSTVDRAKLRSELNTIKATLNETK